MVLRRRISTIWLALGALLAAQIWYFEQTADLRPAIEDMPPPPTATALRAIAFGDQEFLFRHLSRWLQGVGDGGGRLHPLREFDYDDVIGWFHALDALNEGRSEYVHAIAAEYFGLVFISPPRVRKVFDYLLSVALADPGREWQWLVWDARMVRYPLADRHLARSLARDIESIPDSAGMPPWIRLLPVRLLQFAGDEPAALAALRRIPAADMAAINEMRRLANEAFSREHPPSVGNSGAK